MREWEVSPALFGDGDESSLIFSRYNDTGISLAFGDESHRIHCLSARRPNRQATYRLIPIV
jgi:hypothetical protein